MFIGLRTFGKHGKKTFKIVSILSILGNRLENNVSWFAHLWKTLLRTTHAHLVTSLSTSRQQVVFALLVTSCQQVWNNLDDIIRLAC
jgi:hypothetical protein